MARHKSPGVACPQMIDPSIDCLAYMLLSELELGDTAATGPGAVRELLLGGPARKPLAIVVTTDPVSHAVNDLRGMAVLLGVPVVHALPRAALGEAMRTTCPLVLVAITALPHTTARNLLCTLMTRAASACGEFAQRLAVASAVPPVPCALSTSTVPEALAETLRALVL